MKQEKFACDLCCLLSLFIKEMEVNYLCINHATKKNWELWVDVEINSIQAVPVQSCLVICSPQLGSEGRAHLTNQFLLSARQVCQFPAGSVKGRYLYTRLKAFQRGSSWIAVFVYLTSCVCVCVVFSWQLCLKYLCFLYLFWTEVLSVVRGEGIVHCFYFEGTGFAY